MKLYWKIASRNLVRNWRRSLLTGSSVAIGLIGINLLGGYILRMERYLAAQSIYLNYTGHLIVYEKDGLEKHLSQPAKYSISEKEQLLLDQFTKNDSKIERTGKIIRGAGLLNNGCTTYPFYLTAIEPSTAAWAHDHYLVKRYVKELSQFSQGQGFWNFPDNTSVINITSRIASAIHKQKTILDKDHTDLSTQIINCNNKEEQNLLQNDISIQLMGLGFEGGLALADASIGGFYSTGMAFSDDTSIITSLDFAKKFYNTNRVTAYTIYLKDESNLNIVRNDLKQFIQNQGLNLDLYAFSDEAISPFYVGGMNFNWVMLGFFVALVCSVVAISIFNSLYISLMERKAELGTLRSLGFKQKDITKLFLTESVMLASISIAAGIILSFVVMFTVNSANIRIEIPGLAGDIQFVLRVTPLLAIVSLLLLFILVQISSFYGTKKFLRKNILELLGVAT